MSVVDQHSKNVEKNESGKKEDMHAKMSAAAKKAWVTIKAKKAASGKVSGKKLDTKRLAKALSKAVEDSGDLKAVEKKELNELNGVELSKMAHETQKKLDRREVIESAKKGMQEKKALTVGKVIKKARVERANGGVAFIRA